MRYSITVELPEPVSTDRAADALDGLEDWYDSASMTTTGTVSGGFDRIEVDGEVPHSLLADWIVESLRDDLGRRAVIACELSD